MKNITKNEMIILIEESTSMKEILVKLGMSYNGSGGYTNLKNKIIKLGLEIPNYKYRNNNLITKRKTNEEVFVENSNYGRTHLKKRIIKQQLIEYSCSFCNNNGFWNNEKLSLHLDHINGINNDNRLSNLRFLCPNCHSQTPTYAGKTNKIIRYCKCGNVINGQGKYCDSCFSNFKEKYIKDGVDITHTITPKNVENFTKQRKVERPPYEQLIKEIEETNYSAVGRKYGVSDNAIRKWVKFYEKYNK